MAGQVSANLMAITGFLLPTVFLRRLTVAIAEHKNQLADIRKLKPGPYCYLNH
jgi:hypothetical protein